MPTKIVNRTLFEYIYDAIVSVPVKERFDKLERVDFKKVSTPAKIKAFSENANIEEKAIMLSRLGKGFGMVIWDIEKAGKASIKDVLIAYSELSPTDAVELSIKAKQYAIVDGDIVRGTTTLSKATQSKVWQMNQKYLELTNKLPSVTRKLESKIEADHNYSYALGILSKALDGSFCEAHKMSPEQVRVLLFLADCPNGAKAETIAAKLSRKRGVPRMLKPMLERNIIAKSSTSKGVFEIATYGHIILEQILTYVF